MVTNKVPIKFLKKISFAVEKFFKRYPTKKVKNLENSPHHIAAELGMFSLFKFICEKINETNPSYINGANGATPLHRAAKGGHLKIVK